MPLALFVVVLCLLVLANVAYPIQQALATHGIVYYTNANDETSYLLYDFARAIASPLRPGQYLVVVGHMLGLSAGWQNLIADLVTPLAFALGVLWLFRRMGWEAAQARLATLAVLVVPLLVSAINPLVHSLSFHNSLAGTIAWFNIADTPGAPLLRTPEPQTTWLMVVGALMVCARFRSLLPLLLITPFTYSFVGFPTAFAAMAWELHRHWRWRTAAIWGPLALSWLAIALAAAAYFHHASDPHIRILLVASHAPMLSFSTLIALALYAALRTQIPQPWRFPALAIALAPLAACNEQLISGYLAQPSDFEQFTGIFSVAIVLVLGARAWPRAYPALVLAGIALWSWNAATTYDYNAYVNGLVPFDGRLATALHADPRHVAINDSELASVLDMAYPRQAPTALGFDQGGPAVADRYLDGYRQVRRQVLAEQPKDVGFIREIAVLDDYYRYGGQDFVLINLHRKHDLVLSHKVEADGQRPDTTPLTYFIVPSDRLLAAAQHPETPKLFVK